jgi:hypothetical protein
MKTSDADRQRELDRLREQEREFGDLMRAIKHPFVRLFRDPSGRIIGAQRFGNASSNRGLVKKVTRRDARGRIAEILHIPVTDPGEVAAATLAAQTERSIRAVAGPAAVVTVSEAAFENLPRSADLEAIRLDYERIAGALTGKRVTLTIPGPCGEAAATLYARVKDSLTSMPAGARSVVTVSADKLPPELNAEKITRGLAAIIGQRHPDKAAHVEIVLERTSAQPAVGTSRPVGFRPAQDESHRVGDWSQAERVDS